MKSFLLFVFFLLSAFGLARAGNSEPGIASESVGHMDLLKHSESMSGQQELLFIKNVGQIRDELGKVRDDVEFVMRGGGFQVFVGKGSLHYQWMKRTDEPAGGVDMKRHLLENRTESPAAGATYDVSRIDMQVRDADPLAVWEMLEPHPYFERYYFSMDESGYRVANTSRRLICRNIYPGIDWVLYIPAADSDSNRNGIKYDFIVREEGHAEDIALVFKGGSNPRLEQDGSFVMDTELGQLQEAAPRSFLEDGTSVRSGYRLEGNVLKFETDPYQGVLTIDPEVKWSTYFGGSGADFGRALSGDYYGKIYMAGYTNSPNNIATVSAYQSSLSASGNTDGFVAKFDMNGMREWATYFSGVNTRGVSETYAMDVEAISGWPIIIGYTNCDNSFTTPDVFQETFGGGRFDAFLIGFDEFGELLWSTYYGGEEDDLGLAVVLSEYGNLYFAGQTNSLTNISTLPSGVVQPELAGKTDGFIGSASFISHVDWVTYYGTSGNDAVTSLCAGEIYGSVYVGGYQSPAGTLPEGFVAKIGNYGAANFWKQTISGNGADYIWALAGAPHYHSKIYGVGETSSTGIATGGQTVLGGGSDAYISAFSIFGNPLGATYFGGPGNEAASSATYVHNTGMLYIHGCATSPTDIAYNYTPQSTFGGYTDAFVAKFSTEASYWNLHWGGYLGGEGYDFGQAICVNESRPQSVFVCGYTNSTASISTSGVHQASYGGGESDAYLARIDDCPEINNLVISGPEKVCRNSSGVFSVPYYPGCTYTWSLPTGWTRSGNSNVINVSTSWSSNPSGNISVTVADQCGNIYSSAVKSINTYPTQQPYYDARNCVLQILPYPASFTVYWWSRDCVSLRGGTIHHIIGYSNSIYVTCNSNYYAKVIEEGCISDVMSGVQNYYEVTNVVPAGCNPNCTWGIECDCICEM